MRGLLCMASARSSPRLPIVARRARPHASAVLRQVYRPYEGEGAPRVARPVQALGGTVRPAPAAAPPRAFAAVPAPCCCAWRCRAGRWGRTTRRWMRRRWRCRSSAAAEACALMAGARGRLARVRGWAGAARRGRTVGAQGGAHHRARGAAGGGRLAEPEATVSDHAAALTRPRRCADA
jgi:hypothetical protein